MKDEEGRPKLRNLPDRCTDEEMAYKINVYLEKPKQRYYLLVSALHWIYREGSFEMSKYAERITGALMEAGRPGPMNGLTSGYYACYGILPPVPLGGKSPGVIQRPWRGYDVDPNLKDHWLEDLNCLPGMDLISIEEGEGQLRPAHIVLRIPDKKEEDDLAKKVLKIKKMKGRYIHLDRDMKDNRLITIAGLVMPGDVDWFRWFQGTVDFLKRIG